MTALIGKLLVVDRHCNLRLLHYSLSQTVQDQGSATMQACYGNRFVLSHDETQLLDIREHKRRELHTTRGQASKLVWGPMGYGVFMPTG